MTKRAKWAFSKKEDADKFKAENGGDLGTFEQAIKWPTRICIRIQK